MGRYIDDLNRKSDFSLSPWSPSWQPSGNILKVFHIFLPKPFQQSRFFRLDKIEVISYEEEQ